MRGTKFSAWRWSLLGLLVLAGPGGSAVEAATLRWKFRPGENLLYSMDLKTVVTAKFAGGQELKTTMMQTLELSWAVKSVNDDGSAELSQTIVRVVDKGDGPFGKFEYDSKSGQEPQGPIASSRVPLFKAILGVPITFKMSAQGEPSDVKVPDKLTQSLREAGPAAAAASQLFSEEGLKNLILQATLILPKDDVSPGKSWNRQEKQTSPDGATLTLDTTYTDQGTESVGGQPAEKIIQTTRINIQPPADAKEQPPEKIKAPEAQGVNHFDSNAGHLLDSQVNSKIERTGSLQGAEMTQILETISTQKLLKAEAPK